MCGSCSQFQRLPSIRKTDMATDPATTFVHQRGLSWQSRFNQRCLFLFLFLLLTVWLLHSPAHASDIYRWTDADGQTHFGDQPPRNARAPSKIDSGPYTISEEQKASALKQAIDRNARAEAMRNARVATERTDTTSAKSVQPVQPVNKNQTRSTKDCAALYAEYKANQECYAPFHFPKGLRPGAVEKCGLGFPDPSPQCGITPEYRE